MELNENNNKICQPELLNIQLKEHQKTAIYAMNELEQKGYIINNDDYDEIIETNIGFLGDKVGSGKSYMVIGLICHNLVTKNNPIIKSNTNFCCRKIIYKTNIIQTNLIIVPHGLINQWIEYIKNSKLKYIKINKKVDFEFFDNKKDDIKNYQIALLSANNFQSFYSTFKDYKWNRIFIDEVDSITIKNFNISFFISNFIWLITATYENLYNTNRNVIKNFCDSFSTKQHIYSKILIKNNNDFVNKSLELPNIIINNIICNTPNDLLIIKNFIPINILNICNAGNIDEAIKILNCNVDTNENIIQVVTKKIKNKIHNDQIKLTSLNKMQGINQKIEKIEKLKIKIQRSENRLKNITDKINGIDNEFCAICISEINKPVLLNCECKSIFCFECIIPWLDKKKNCPNCRNNITKNDINIIDNTIKKEKEEKKEEKKDKLDELIDKIINKKNGKFLIFSNYDESFYKIYEKLNEHKILHNTIKGTIEHTTKLIKNFNDNNTTNVLMLNAKYNGTGLNLQMATDIILFHRFHPLVEKQIIGRAQRIGRKEPLIVHQLLYENE